MHCEESECSLQTLEARSPIGYWAALFDVVNTRHHNMINHKTDYQLRIKNIYKGI